MHGWKKILIGLMAGGVALLFVSILLVKVFVTPEKVRDLLQSGLEKSLQRKVDLGKVEVGLFKGIQLERLKIDSKNGKETLLLAQNIELSYDFSALFRGELLFSNILIKEPQLRLVRESDGRLNIADLLGEQPDATPEAESEVVSTNPDAAIGIPLRVKKFSLQGGSLLFVDRKLNSQSPYLYRLEKLDLEVDNFSLSKPFTANLAASINDSSLSAELRFDFNDGLHEIQLHCNQLNLVPFLPYLRDILPGRLRQGSLSTEIRVTNKQDGLAVAGQIILDQIDFSLNGESPMRWQNLRLTADQDLFYRHSDQIVEVKDLQLNVNAAQVGYRGKLLLSEPLQLAGEASLKVNDLRKIAALLPLSMRRQVQAYAVAGAIEVAFQLEGQPVGIEVVRQVTLKASDLQASFGTLRPAVNGTLNYAAGRLAGKQLMVDINGQQLAVDLDVPKLLQRIPLVQLNITGQKLVLDELLPQQTEQAVPDSGIRVERQVAAQIAPTKILKRDPLVLPVTAQANLEFARIIYQGLSLEEVKGQILLAEGKLDIVSITAGVADGVANINAEVELAKPSLPYRGRLDMRGINLAALTDALLPEGKGSTSGLLSAVSNFNGLVGPDDMLAGLNVLGEFDLIDGQIKGNPLLAGLAGFLTNPQLEVLGFSRLHGNYGLKQKQGTIDAVLESSQVIIAPKGSFSLDGPLNLSLETRISPELMRKSGVGGKGADLFKDENGWSLFPLKVKGNYSSPRFTLDSSGVKTQIKKGVTRELGRQLQKQLGDDTDDAGNQQLQKLLDGTLRKLFGN